VALPGAQGFPHEPNPSTPMQAGTSPIEAWYSGVVNQTAYSALALPVFDGVRARTYTIGRDCVLSAIAFEVTTGAGGAVGRVALYRSTSGRNIYPSSLVVDGGEFDCSTTGIKVTTGLSIFLKAGLYWVMATQGVATATLRSVQGGGGPTVIGALTTLGGNPNSSLSLTRSYAPFSATFEAGAGQSTNHCPAIHLLLSA
jgi:hypothetical protein